MRILICIQKKQNRGTYAKNMKRGEDRMSNENTTAEEIRCDVLRNANEDLENRIKYLERQIAYKDGMIDGLKFAIRCDGVSGGEVR